MKRTIRVGWLFLFLASGGWCGDAPVSDATGECLDCHSSVTPGIVEDWYKSRHAKVTPGAAMKVEGLSRKVSGKNVPEERKDVAVGCAECHTLRNDSHADAFDHNGTEIHVVVSPSDCATCHSQEAEQFSENIMSHARNNLYGNPLFQDLKQTIIGKPVLKEGRIRFETSDDATDAEACAYCHGTVLSLSGMEERETEAGTMAFPVIAGWPNQGVGRINLDGSRGSCAACHTRHAFSMEMARKPHTCKECHSGPDVPAFKVYEVSKHGNIYSSLSTSWNFSTVPWTIGKDFTAPTCAACHMSLLANTDGIAVVERSHKVNDRLPWRIFGLIYAHPQPINPDITGIRNKDGMPLPTDFEGGFASAYLLDAKTMESRKNTMQSACLQCHDSSWVKGHWERFDKTIRETNHATRIATEIMGRIWNQALAEGLPAGSPFDEAVEKKWSEVWLFHANIVRFASAMAGGGDLGVFDQGRWHLAARLTELNDWLNLRSGSTKK